MSNLFYGWVMRPLRFHEFPATENNTISLCHGKVPLTIMAGLVFYNGIGVHCCEGAKAMYSY